ncbi:MAG: hypothetical protein ABH821_03695, partial [archaeon]
QLELVKGILALTQVIEPEIEKNVIGFLKESFEDRDLQDLSNDWKYLLFCSMLKNVGEAKFYPIKSISEWAAEEISFDNPAKLKNWIGKTLSRIPLFKKRRIGKGIEYHLSPSSIKEYMDLTGFPTDTTEPSPIIITIDGDKVKDIGEPILDNCSICGKREYVKYCSIEKIGKNYCGECIGNKRKLADFA